MTEQFERAFTDEELASMQEQGNWNHFETSLFRTCQRLFAEKAITPRPRQTSVQWEPPYPDHETAIISIRYPYHTAHKPTLLCAVQEPHRIEDCGEFER